MDGKRFVQPRAQISGRMRYLCVRRLLSEFGGQTASTSLEDKRSMGSWLAERNGDVWTVCAPGGRGRLLLCKGLSCVHTPQMGKNEPHESRNGVGEELP